MPKISTYGTVTPAASDRIVVSDANDSNATKNITVGSLSSATAISYYVDAYDIGPRTVAISTADDFVTIPNIIFSASGQAGFDVSGGNVVKNISGVGLTACKIIAFLNVKTSSGGGDQNIALRFIKNTTSIPTAEGHATVNQNHPGEITLGTIQSLALNDTIGLQIKNVGSTTDLVIDHVNLIITSL
jgi:hypothetical protein